MRKAACFLVSHCNGICTTVTTDVAAAAAAVVVVGGGAIELRVESFVYFFWFLFLFAS